MGRHDMSELAGRYADQVFVADRIYPDPDAPGVYQGALAVTGGSVSAVGDDLGSLGDIVSPATQVIDLPGSYILPGFDDTHTHLMAAVESVGLPNLDGARSITELLGLLREHVRATEPSGWILTGSHWQELNLAERRLPTRTELDTVSTAHPILLRRGGHNAVANSLALALAGIEDDVTDMPGGQFERGADGRVNGRLLDNAVFAVARVIPAASRSERIEAMGCASAEYAASGTTAVRDCYVPLDDLDFLYSCAEAGELHVRVRALVGTAGMTSADQIEDLLTSLAPWRTRQSDFLQVWGVKFVLDGGLEAGATTEHYCGRPDYYGLLIWEPAELEQAIDAVVSAGWRVGVHAYGDRAVETILGIFEHTRARHPALPVGDLVIEHAGISNAVQRQRAASLGIAVTIQHPLLHDTAHVQETHWGAERVDNLFPVRSWMQEGVSIAAGSDYPVGMYGPMRSVWGMVTRQTVAGIRGRCEAVDRRTAICLHTTRAVQMLGEQGRRGRLWPGHAADFTVWPADPYLVPVAELEHLIPRQTWIDGVQRAGDQPWA